MTKSESKKTDTKNARSAPGAGVCIELTQTECRRLGIAMSNAVSPYCKHSGLARPGSAEDVRDTVSRLAADIGVHLPRQEGEFASTKEQRAWFVHAARAFRMAGKRGDGALDKRIAYIAELLKLDPLERDILGVAARRLLFPQ